MGYDESAAAATRAKMAMNEFENSVHIIHDKLQNSTTTTNNGGFDRTVIESTIRGALSWIDDNRDADIFSILDMHKEFEDIIREWYPKG